LLSDVGEDEVEDLVPAPECDVVLGDLLLAVVGEPDVDFDGDEEGGGVEGDDDGGGGDVVVGGEVDDVVGDGDADDGCGARVEGGAAEEGEEVFGVELPVKWWESM
jgi:hypothetical protein